MLDPSDYWRASIRVNRLLALPWGKAGAADREEYLACIAVIDETSQQVIEGSTTGISILDRLIASGHILSPKKLEELQTAERMLVTDEPALLQQGRFWRLGIVLRNEIYFNRVDRRSYFAPISRGYQAIPVRSYVEVEIDVFVSNSEVETI